MKQKICKGNYRSEYYEGCGKLGYPYRYDLCHSCFIKWTQTTEAGGEYIRKITIPQAKKEVRIKEQKQTKEKKIDLLSKDAYRKQYLQPVINEIVRIIDKDQDCIANVDAFASDAGHFISAGSNRQTALNLHNIHLQSRNSNSFKGGEDLKYYKGLIRKYGQKYADFCETLRQSKQRHSKIDYIEAFSKAKEFRLIFKKKDLVYTAQHRIELRNQANEFIGLYEEEFTKFNV
jgi:hypothetical protein